MYTRNFVPECLGILKYVIYAFLLIDAFTPMGQNITSVILCDVFGHIGVNAFTPNIACISSSDVFGHKESTYMRRPYQKMQAIAFRRRKEGTSFFRKLALLFLKISNYTWPLHS
jgi:hypothetical protein